MTINTELSKRIYVGNGIATDYDYDFKIFVESDLRVSLIAADGTETVQVLNTNYTVSGEGFEAGGKVSFVAAPAAGIIILIMSAVPYTQPTDYKNQGRFFPETHENTYDRATRQVLQLKELQSRSITIPAYIEGVSTDLPEPVADTLIGFNSALTGMRTFTLAEIASVVAYANKLYQTFTGTGAQVNFTLSADPSSIGNLEISIDGVMQVPLADYTYAGTTLTFATAPANGSVILVRFDQALPVGAIVASLISFTPAGTGAVTRSIESKLRDVIHASDYGVVANGTDQYAHLVAAYNQLVALGGGDLILPPGEICIATGFVVSNPNIFLRGGGYQKHSSVNAGSSTRWTQYGGTILKWIGATGGGTTMLSFRPPATGPALYGCGMDGIILDADDKADYCLEILSNQAGRFPRIMAADARVRNIHIGVMASGPWTSVDPRDTQHCHFGSMFSRSWLTTALGAEGILIDGDDNADVSLDRIDAIHYIHKNGTGLKFKSCDGINVGTVYGFQIAGGAATGVRIEGGVSVTDYPRKLHFDFIQPGAGGLGVIENTLPPLDIVCDVYSLGNGSPAPTVNKNCIFSYTLDTGATRALSSTALQSDDLVRETNTAGSILGRRRFQGQNSAGTRTTYAAVTGYLLTNTAGSEAGRLYLDTIVAGAFASRGWVGQGLVLDTAVTGGDKGLGTINLSAAYYVAGNKVVGARETGWTAGTGTPNKGAFAAYAGATMSAGYVQAEAQATNDAAKAASQRIKAIEDMLRTHGLMN